jgi:hypothetical protein
VAGFIEPLPGNATFTDKLMGIAARIGTMEIPFAAVVEDFRAIEAKRWGNEGPGWDDLKTTTIDRKERGGWGDMPTMVRTADLVDSLAHGAGYGFTEITPFSVKMGTSAPYAGYHQIGTPNMAARPLVDDSEAGVEATAIAWGLIIEDYIFRGLL